MLCKPVPVELKFAAGAEGRFRGLAATYGPQPDRQGDVILPGAFRATLAAWKSRGAAIPLLWDHDRSEPIGAILSAVETDEGLEVEGKLVAGIANAERAMGLMETGGLSMSIGFRIVPGGARLRDSGIRELLILDVFEISLVAVPADPRAVVRSVKADIRSFEATARDVLGLSGREAKRLAAGGYAAMVRDGPPAKPDTSPHELQHVADALLSTIQSLREGN